MLIRRASALSAATIHHFRRISTAALLKEIDTPPVFTYLDGFPKPSPKHDETIHAIPRDTSGKSIAAKVRKAGRVPSIIFEAEDGQHGGNKRLISVQGNQIKKLVNHLGQSFFLSRLFDLDVRPEFGSGEVMEKVRVLPRLLHLHPSTDSVLNVTFIRAPSGAWLKVDVPLVFRGEDVSPGLKKGSTLNIIKRTVKYLCPADIIPPFIDVDLSELDVGQKIMAGNLSVHPALKLLISKDEPIVKIMGARVSELKKSNWNVTYYKMYHPLSGHCVQIVKNEIVVANCKSASRWDQLQDGGPIKLSGNPLCLGVAGEGAGARVSKDCSSKWKLASSAALQLAAQNGKGGNLCLEMNASNYKVVTKKCLCVGAILVMYLLVLKLQRHNGLSLFHQMYDVVKYY